MSQLAIIPPSRTEETATDKGGSRFQDLKNAAFREAGKTVDDGAAIRKAVVDTLLKATDFGLGLLSRTVKGTAFATVATAAAMFAAGVHIANKFQSWRETQREKQSALIETMLGVEYKQVTSAIEKSQLPAETKAQFAEALLRTGTDAATAMEKADKLDSKAKLATYKEIRTSMQESVGAILADVVKEQKSRNLSGLPGLEEKFAGLKAAQIEQIRAAGLDRSDRVMEERTFTSALRKGTAELVAAHKKMKPTISSDLEADTGKPAAEVALRRGIRSLLEESANLSAALSLAVAKVKLVADLDVQSDIRMSATIQAKRAAQDEALAVLAAKKRALFSGPKEAKPAGPVIDIEPLALTDGNTAS